MDQDYTGGRKYDDTDVSQVMCRVRRAIQNVAPLTLPVSATQSQKSPAFFMSLSPVSSDQLLNPDVS
jgi:hypothetical protein